MNVGSQERYCVHVHKSYMILCWYFILHGPSFPSYSADRFLRGPLQALSPARPMLILALNVWHTSERYQTLSSSQTPAFSGQTVESSSEARGSLKQPIIPATSPPYNKRIIPGSSARTLLPAAVTRLNPKTQSRLSVFGSPGPVASS